jgi:glycosyltransferase involved in cell wall biosynthesis
MSDPLVSVIVPVYNGERFLREAIESILAQTYSPIEVIVVDDGSTDDTAEIARSFGDRVRCIRQANAGPAVARNNGLAAATGEFVAFLDADDTWTSEKLARQLACFDADPDLGICVTHVQNVWEREMAAEEARFRDHPRSRPIPGYVTQTLLARRDVFDRVGPFDVALGHGDATDWFMRAERAGIRRTLLPDVLVHRRLHRDNLSRRESAASREEFLKLVKASLDRKRQS